MRSEREAGGDREGKQRLVNCYGDMGYMPVSGQGTPTCHFTPEASKWFRGHTPVLSSWPAFLLMRGAIYGRRPVITWCHLRPIRVRSGLEAGRDWRLFEAPGGRFAPPRCGGGVGGGGGGSLTMC